MKSTKCQPCRDKTFFQCFTKSTLLLKQASKTSLFQDFHRNTIKRCKDTTGQKEKKQHTQSNTWGGITNHHHQLRGKKKPLQDNNQQPRSYIPTINPPVGPIGALSLTRTLNSSLFALYPIMVWCDTCSTISQYDPGPPPQ